MEYDLHLIHHKVPKTFIAVSGPYTLCELIFPFAPLNVFRYVHKFMKHSEILLHLLLSMTSAWFFFSHPFLFAVTLYEPCYMRAYITEIFQRIPL